MTLEQEIDQLRDLLRIADTALHNADQATRWEHGDPSKYIGPARAKIKEYFDGTNARRKADALRTALDALDREANPERWETLNDLLVEVESRR